VKVHIIPLSFDMLGIIHKNNTLILQLYSIE